MYKKSLICLMVSLFGDEGKTFSEPETIWEKDRFTIANSCIKRLSSGRVVMPVCYPEDNYRARVLYSDDDCNTWEIGQQSIYLPMRGVMEPFIAELNNGRLIMVMRNQLGYVCVCLLTYWACPYDANWFMSGWIDLKLARFRVRK